MADSAATRAVIFDMDGVLTDSEPLINEAAVAMFRELGFEVAPEDFTPFVGTGEDRYLGGVADEHGFAIDLPAAKKRTYEIYLDLVPKRLRAFPGACELVRLCRHAGLKIAVASSADRIKIDANLRQIGLPPESWDAIVTGDDVERKKPAPDIFLAAARKLDVSPVHCVVVEDAPNGIQAANAAGIRCIAVAQTFPADQLAAAPELRSTVADITITDLTRASGSTPQPIADSPPPLVAPNQSRPAPARPWGFWATLGLALLIASVVILMELGVGVITGIALATGDRIDRIEDLTLGANGFFWAVVTLVTTPVYVGLVVLVAWLKQGLTVREYLALRRLPRRNLLRWCLLLLGFAVLADLTTILLHQPIVPDVMLEAYRTAGWPPLFWIAVVVFAPVGEELFFRGFLFKGWLHSPVGGWGTVVLTSLIWAAMHQQYELYGIGIIFAVGLLLGYSRLRTGSVYPAIVMHTLMNILAMAQTAAFLRYFD